MRTYASGQHVLRGVRGAVLALVVRQEDTSLSVGVLQGGGEREFFIDNLLVRIHLIIEIILVDRPGAIGV
jgi:hypothetical protein